MIRWAVSCGNLLAKKKIIKIGYGLYAKAKQSLLTGAVVPMIPLPTLAREAIEKLGLKTYPSRLEQEYNAGRTSQVPTGRLIAVEGRINRRIGYNGVYISYERAIIIESNIKMDKDCYD